MYDGVLSFVNMYLHENKNICRTLLSRVGNSLFCSKSLFLNSLCEGFTLNALLKRATVRELLSSLFTKEWRVRITLFLSKTSNSLKNQSCCSSLRRSFLKSDGSDSLSLLFKKGDRERFAPVALFNKEQNRDSLFRSQKASDSLEKPKSEFPTLLFSC